MLDFEDDSVTGGFAITPAMALYRADLNDPQLANASQTQIVFELCHTYEYWVNNVQASKRNCINMRLAKSILLNEGLPGDCLSVSPIQLFEKLTQNEIVELKGEKQRPRVPLSQKEQSHAYQVQQTT